MTMQTSWQVSGESHSPVHNSMTLHRCPISFHSPGNGAGLAAKTTTATAPETETYLGDKVYVHRVCIYQHGAWQNKEKCHD